MPNLRRAASSNILGLEQRRQELELRNWEADIKQKELDSRIKELEVEKLELDLMERRRRLQDPDLTGM